MSFPAIRRLWNPSRWFHALLFLAATGAVLPVQGVAAPTFLRQWGTTGTGPGQLLSPYGMAISANGEVFISDQGREDVQVFTSEGQFLRVFVLPPPGPPQFVPRLFSLAAGISDDGNGHLFVVSMAHEISKWSTDGTLLAFGNPFPSWAPGGCPVDIATDHNGRIFVTDTCAGAIQMLTDSLQLLESRNGGVSSMLPFACATDNYGDVIAVDRHGVIYKLLPNGTLGGQWPVGVGSGPGQLANDPRGIAVDASGRIYVADTGNNRVEVFSDGGVFLEAFGSLGSGPGQFHFPTDIAIDPSGNIFVLDAGNARVQVFSQAIAVTPTSWSHVKQTYR